MLTDEVSARYIAWRDNDGRNIYKCIICSNDFDEETIVKKHIANAHGVSEEKSRHIELIDDDGRKIFKCVICSTEFPQEVIVKKHIADVHGKALFRCTFESCDYSNARRNHFLNHISTVHEGLKPHQCNICNNSFTLKSSLRKHISVIHEKKKPYKCETCDTSFAQSAHLKGL